MRSLSSSYANDPFCSQLLRNLSSSPGFSQQDGLLYFEEERLVVPQDPQVRETLLHDAHDALGHLGPRKTLSSLSQSFYWPGASPFEIVLGYRPSLIRSTPSALSSLPAVEEVMCERETRIGEVRDALAAAKVRQAEQANERRGGEVDYKVGDMVMVDSADRRARYKTKGGDTRAAKLFPRWDGPYPVEAAFPDTSNYRLTLPPSDRAHPTFHSSKLKPYHNNDPTLFPGREPPRPEPIDVEGEKKYQVEAIVDEKGKGRTRKFLVRWAGYPDSENTWEPAVNLEDTAALESWEVAKEGGRA
ncbi:hypothetical protein JCM11641_002809 [Rhodosporidiobolus odoratus]